MLPVISKPKSDLVSKVSNLPYLERVNQDGTWFQTYNKHLDQFQQTSSDYSQKYKYEEVKNIERLVDGHIRKISKTKHRRDVEKNQDEEKFLIMSGTLNKQGLIQPDKHLFEEQDSDIITLNKFEKLKDEETFCKLKDIFCYRKNVNVMDIEDQYTIWRSNSPPDASQMDCYYTLLKICSKSNTHIIFAWENSDTSKTMIETLNQIDQHQTNTEFINNVI